MIWQLLLVCFPVFYWGQAAPSSSPIDEALGVQATYKTDAGLFKSRWAMAKPEGSAREKVSFDETRRDGNYRFWYDEPGANEYLKRLREEYGLAKLIQDTGTDIERVSKVLNWVHKQWKHNGNTEPKRHDALSILEEAKGGKRFRCVEYAIVASACLNSLGLKSRVLALKTKGVETTSSGAGHVVTEVFLNDLQKWAMVDGQWDAMPVLNGVPLNAVELQNAIVSDFENLQIRSMSGTAKKGYVKWIFPYLYYFDVSFDNRHGAEKRELIDGKSCLMLVPLKAKEPVIFQIKSKIDYCKYTNSIADFYVKS